MTPIPATPHDEAMTGLEFVTLCLPWWNADNLFNENPNRNIETNNGVAYTSEYLVALTLLSEPKPTRGEVAHRIHTSLDPCEKMPGLWKRSPTSTLDNAHDDPHQLATMAALTGEVDYAERIVKHGQWHGWCYNLNAPEIYEPRFDHSRILGVIQHYQMAAKAPLSLIDQAQWLLSMSWPGSHSGNRMKWHRFLAHQKWPHKTVLTILGVQIFRYWFKKKYPTGLAGEMYALHFEKHGKTHPLAQALWGIME